MAGASLKMSPFVVGGYDVELNHFCRRSANAWSYPFRSRIGEFGDPAGYEETLYKTEKGYFFLYVNGGEESPYTKEDIKCMSAKKAEEWLANK